MSLPYSEISMNFEERRAFLDANEGRYTDARWRQVNDRLAHDIAVFKIAKAKKIGVACL